MNPLRLVLLILSGGAGLMTIAWLLLKQFGLWSVSLFLSVMIVIALVTLLIKWSKRKKGQAQQKKQSPGAIAQQKEQEAISEDLRKAAKDRERWVLRAITSVFKQLAVRVDGNPYDLPLYLMIGPEGAGKTQLLKAFGLVRMRTPELEEASDCLEVWGSEHLVVVKLWGRLYEQGGGESDVQLWEKTLQKLLQQKPRRCLNGILVTLPVTLLTTEQTDVREQQTTFLRRRLRETCRTLGQKLPVYMLITQSDRLAGFSGAFRMALPGETEQCLGALVDDPSLDKGFRQEWFEKSWSRLRVAIERRITLALNEETEARHRGDIITLSWQLRCLGPNLLEVLGTVFSRHPLGLSLHLRGYFLTGRGGDNPTEDPLVRYLNGHYGFVGAEVPLPVATASTALFSKGLVPGVLLPEISLAGRNIRRVWWWRLGYSGWLAFCILLVALTGLWTFENLKYVQERGYTLRDTWNRVRAEPPNNDDLLSTIRWMGTLHTMIESYRHPVPWYISSWFINHGQGKALYHHWLHELNEKLRPKLLEWLASSVEKDLGQNRPDRLVTSIQFYLALTGQKSLSPNEASRQRLVGLVLGEEHPRLEDALYEQLSVLIQHPGMVAERNTVFMDLLHKRWQKLGSGDVFLQNIAGLKGLVHIPVTRFFSPNFLSTFTLSEDLEKKGVPLLYTARGAGQMDLKPDDETLRIYLAIRQAIFHPQLTDISAAEKRQALQTIWDSYFLNYRTFWQQFLSSLSLRPLKSPEQLVQLLNRLGSPGDSPLETLVTLVVTNTRLGHTQTSQSESPSGSSSHASQASVTATSQVKAVEAQATSANLKKEAASPKTTLAKLFKKKPEAHRDTQLPVSQVEDLANRFGEYAQLNQSTGKEPALLDTLTHQLHTLTIQVNPALTGEKADDLAFQLMNAAATGKGTGITWPQALSDRLPEVPVRLMTDIHNTLIHFLLDGAARQINKVWQRDVFPVWENSLSSRYPFNSRGQDADPSRVESFFATDGVFDQFTVSCLKPFSNLRRDSQGQLLLEKKSVEGEFLPLQAGFWQQVRGVSYLRELLFDSHHRLSMTLQLKASAMSPRATLLRLESDSGVLTSRHGPAQWHTLQSTGASAGNPLTLSLLSDDLVLAEQHWSGPWRWLRWLEAGKMTPVSDGVFKVDYTLRDYQAEFMVRPPGSHWPQSLLGQLRLPESLQ